MGTRLAKISVMALTPSFGRGSAGTPLYAIKGSCNSPSACGLWLYVSCPTVSNQHSACGPFVRVTLEQFSFVSTCCGTAVPYCLLWNCGPTLLALGLSHLACSGPAIPFCLLWDSSPRFSPRLLLPLLWASGSIVKDLRACCKLRA